MTRNRLDIPRAVGGISQRRSQFSHGLVQAAIEIHKRVGRPKFSPQFLAGHHFSGMFQKEGKNLERLLLQLDSNAILPQFRCAQVYLKDSKTSGSEGPLNRSHDHSPLQVAERSTQRWPNQYGLHLANAQFRPILGAFAALRVCPDA